MMIETGILGEKTRGREEFTPRQSLLCMNARPPALVQGLFRRHPTGASPNS